MSPPAWSSLRAAWWAHRAAHRTRQHLARGRLDDLVVIAPPALPPADRRWVSALLRIRGDTCLVRSAVLQEWDAAHGWHRDLIIGVTSPTEGFRAHAWLDGEPARLSAGFQELTRRPPPEQDADCGRA
ncbi:MAG: lasso peptide biosynthesis protein [Acidimicrobiales bacterium]